MQGLWTVIYPYVPRLTPEKGWRDWGQKSGREVAFVGFWELQSRLATICLVVLWALIGWQTLPIMIGWALVATIVYEVAIYMGLESLGSKPEKAMPNIFVRVLSWWLAFGFVPLIYTKFTAWARDHWNSRAANSSTVAAGLVLFGVIPSRQILIEAGVTRNLVPISMMGRFANVPFHLLWTKLYLLILAFVWVQSEGLRDLINFV